MPTSLPGWSNPSAAQGSRGADGATSSSARTRRGASGGTASTCSHGRTPSWPVTPSWSAAVGDDRPPELATFGPIVDPVVRELVDRAQIEHIVLHWSHEVDLLRPARAV